MALPNDDPRQDSPATATRADFVFCVSRNVVVLNDIGDVWLVTQDMRLVSNWDEVIPPPDESDVQDEQVADINS